MPKTLDQLIREAKEALNKTNKDTPEYTAAIARVEALTSVQQAGITKTQDDLNRIDRQVKNAYETSIKETLGMTLGEFEQVVASVEESLPGGEGDGGEEGDGNVLERMRAALQERDTKIDALGSTLSDVNGRYSKDKVDVAVERAFKAAGLDEKFLGPAKSLAGYGDLVEKVEKGESLTNEEIAEKVNSVKTLSEVWFKAEGEEDGGEGGIRTVAGHKLKEEAVSPGIPATPQGGGSSEITDEDRAKRAASAY